MDHEAGEAGCTEAKARVILPIDSLGHRKAKRVTAKRDAESGQAEKHVKIDSGIQSYQQRQALVG